jgi:vacuolar iron transporter family protein
MQRNNSAVSHMSTTPSLLHMESHVAGSNTHLNWLRAAVLGANDGVVSVASVVMGVAAASTDFRSILTAGIAALSAGALAMAGGEYVSVSTQRDTEHALLEKEKWELKNEPEKELHELAQIYMGKGLSAETAQKVAAELTAHDAFAAHAEAELKIDPNDISNPVHAAWASGIAFTCGGIVPIIAMVLSPVSVHLYVTVFSVVIALVVTGVLSAISGGASKMRATVRVVVGGLFAMAATYGIGWLFGVSGI